MDKKINVDMSLTAKQRVFCTEYVKSGKAAEAYKIAYKLPTTDVKALSSRAVTLLRKDKVKWLIEDLRERAATSAVFGVAEVLRRWVDIATADPNDIVKVVVRCCRYCHGFNNEYQYTAVEYQELVDDAIASKQPSPSVRGGITFDIKAPPNENCKQCGGDGVTKTVITDSSLLTGKAKALYAGAKMGKHGIEVIMRDQDDALKSIAKFLGMFKLTIEQTQPAAAIVVPDAKIDPIVAAKMYKQIMTGS